MNSPISIPGYAFLLLPLTVLILHWVVRRAERRIRKLTEWNDRKEWWAAEFHKHMRAADDARKACDFEKEKYHWHSFHYALLKLQWEISHKP